MNCVPCLYTTGYHVGLDTLSAAIDVIGFTIVTIVATIVGDNCVLYQGVTLGGTGNETGKRHPTLGNNVTVGTGAKVYPPACVPAPPNCCCEGQRGVPI